MSDDNRDNDGGPRKPTKWEVSDENPAMMKNHLRMIAVEGRETLDLIKSQVIPSITALSSEFNTHRRANDSQFEILSKLYKDLSGRVAAVEGRAQPDVLDLDGRVSELEAKVLADHAPMAIVAVTPPPTPLLRRRVGVGHVLLFGASMVGNFFAGLAGAFLGR